MIYALLAILIVVFIGLVILTALVIKLTKKPASIESGVSDKELGMLSEQIKS